jgi:aerobic C4-dicarboxylate transport protein
MSEARALVNMIGNGVAAVVMAKWEGELDYARMKAVLDGAPLAEAMSSGAGTELAEQANPVVLWVKA